MKNKFLQFLSSMRRGAAMLLLLLTCVTHAWGSNAHHCLIGDPIVTWKSSDNWSKSYEQFALTSPANSNWDEFCTYMWIETNQKFAFNNHFFNEGDAKQVGPSSNEATLYNNSGTGKGVATDGTTNAWKYTGSTGLVKVCAAQSSGGNSQGEWKPYVWVEESKETEILRGNKIMFYFGMTTGWNENWNVLRTSNTTAKTADQQYHRLPESKCSSWISVAYVSPAQYYVGKTEWAGVQMAATAEAGCLYSVYNDGSDKIYKNVGSIPAFGSSSYDHVAGIAASSISATASNSIYGNSQEIYYYYTTSSNPASASFTAFDPSDISGLSAGTYYLYALGWDGHILVRSNVATLTVRNAPGISLSFENSSGTSISAARSGDVITLKAAPVNCGSTPTILYQVSTSSTFASDVTNINEVASNSQTWTVPASTSDVTYYFRASVTSSGYECTSDISSAFPGYGKKTIHVRNNNDWSSFKIHHWGDNDIDKTTWGYLPSCPNEGGQWYTVVIYNCATGFVLTNEGSNNQDKTIDLAYSGQTSPAVTFTDGGYYEMSTSGSDKQTLSSSSAPATPGATTNEATVSSATSVVFNYSVNANRDKATPGVAFKQSDSNIDDAATLYSGGTKATGSAISGNASGNTSAQTITAGKDWYYVAYGTNSVGTGYGSICKIRTTAVELNRQGGTTGSTSVVAVGGKAMPSATMPTRAGYDFAGYYTSAGGSGTKYYNANGSSANNWPTGQGASVTLHAAWTPLQYDVTLKLNGGTGTEDQVVQATSGQAMPTTIKTAATAIVIPTKTGYNFNGYWDAASGGTQYYTYTGSPAVLASARSFDKAAATTLYAQWVAKTYTVTLDHKGGTSGPSNPTVTYNVKPSNLASLPTRTGYGFDGYWTQDGSSTGDYGIQVINGNGEWISGVAYNTDASGNWIHDGDQTYYAKWLAVGYYVVGGPGLDNWVTKANKIFSGSPLKLELALNKTSFESNKPTLTALFKIREVKEGNSSTDVWFGKGSKDGEVSFGKYNPTEADLNTSGANMQLEVYYNGTYTFEISNIDATPNIDLTVKVPVIDQLQIYSGCDGTVDAYYDWDGAPVDNVVSKTVTLNNCSDPNGFYFKAVYDSEYYGKNSTTLTRASSSATDLSTNGGNILIKTDVKGDYTFNYNVVDHSITVTYPTKRQVNYSAVTLRNGTGADAPTAENDDDDDEAVANGGYVADGYHVTFRAKTAKTGYTFRGWFSKNNPSNWTDGLLEDDAVYTTTINANTTVYAVYSENDYTVTVNATTGGSITTPSAATVTAHATTSASIVSVKENKAWHFTGWTSNSDKVHFANASALSTTVTTTEDATITANFVPRFGLVGSVDATGNPAGGMPADGSGATWNDNYAADFTVVGYTNPGVGDAGITVDLQCARTLEPNTRYKFRVYDREKNTRRACSSDEVLPAEGVNNWQLDKTTNDVHIQTVGRGTYTFHITKLSNDDNNYPSLQVERQASWQVSIGQGFENIDGTITSNSSTGGTMSAKATESGTKVSITNGKYIATGGKLEWSVDPADGYTLGHYYGSSDFSGGSFDFTQIDPVNANANVYAKFVETPTSVTIRANASSYGTVTVGGADFTWGTVTKVGVTTLRNIVVTPNEGYYFARWELSADPDFTLDNNTGDEDNAVTLRGLGAGTSGTLTAVFEPLESIYFRNVFDDGTNPATHWSNVYVHFATNWADYSGQQAVKTSNDDCYADLHVQMEEIGTTHIFRAYVPRFVTKYSKTKVAFANSEDTYRDSYLYTGSACGRSDYNAKHNMFVPNHSKTRDVNGVAYYNSGYWMHYTISEGVDAGYWIERRTEKDKYSGKPADQFVVLERAFEPQPRIRYRLRIDGLNKDKYAIFSEGGLKYKANETITFNNCTDIAVVEDNGSDAYFTLTPTAEGEYIITLDQSGDQMKLSVEYPIVAGDYVIENAFNDGSAKTTRTNIIKASSAGTKTRYSMYLNNAGSGTLRLRKCTSIDGDGKPEWSDGDDTNLSGILSAGDFTPGVYQFDVTVNTSTDKVSEVDSLRLYTGNFYIKTDAASGGWVSYKNNILTKNTVNFDRADASTFDHYFCKYFASKDCNIKSVIANDYCNQLSDTVKGDGIARMYEGEPYVPIDGTSIRFSYNSATNETKRAYLGASYHNGFLNIVPSTDNNVYRTISGNKYDLYDFPTDSAKLKFDDNGNYVYVMDVTVKPGANAGVRAVYNTSYTQMLIPSTNILLGGTGSSEYSIRVVYDFKTNFMMSAFVLTDTPIEENLADFDMLWVRHKDDSPTQLTLGDMKTLSNVRPIGAIEFRYDEMCSSSTSPSKVDLSSWSVYSRPYLKYFISFPFDVHVGSVFGLNDAYYGMDYVIQKYDGATRAADGLFAGDGDNYWINLTQDSIMHANEGYCLILDNDYARWSSSSDMWYNKGAGSSAFIYFPAMDVITIASGAEHSTKVPEHACKINRWWSGSTVKNHIKTDSHWNLIGQPFFHDAYIKSSTNVVGDTVVTDLGAYYYLNYSDNKWYPQAFDKDHSTIKAMSSFFVQWAGDITWTTNSANDKWKDTEPASPAAAPRRVKAEEGKNYLIQLDVELNGKVSDWTFVRLAEEANDDFILREDMFKMYNNGIPNIYTFAGGYDVAYNAVPVKSQIIPMGVLIRKNGTYKFSMPSNFSGTVTLIDKFAQTRTNLALDDYEVTLNKGTIDDRFELEINIQNAPTAIDGVEDGSGSLKDGKAHKFIMNGVMYILENGRLYDARGNRVK